MQDRYLFRGKRVDNGEWVVGSLINNLWTNTKTRQPVCYITGFVDEQYYDSWEHVIDLIDDYEVIPETVGQRTGLKDKNGKLIFEGDKIIDHNGEAVIEWDDQSALFKVRYTNEKRYKLFFSYLKDEFKTIEIIGNVHEEKAKCN